MKATGDLTADMAAVTKATFPHVKVVDANYSVVDDDGDLQVSTANGPVTITLPLSPRDNRVLRIRKTTSNANTLTINPNGHLIDGVLTSWGTGATVDLAEFHLKFISGTGWWSR